MSAKHTPTPWVVEVVKDGGNWTYNIRTLAPHNAAGKIGKHIATTNAYIEATGDNNAEFIVDAVNSYEKLKADNEKLKADNAALLCAAKMARAIMQHRKDIWADIGKALIVLDKAIAQAEGKVRP